LPETGLRRYHGRGPHGSGLSFRGIAGLLQPPGDCHPRQRGIVMSRYAIAALALVAFAAACAPKPEPMAAPITPEPAFTGKF